MNKVLLAPMDGLCDYVLRDVLTMADGYDGGTCEFVRISGSILPKKTYRRICPELDTKSATASGVPIAVQLLGSHPEFMAENAAQLCLLSPAGIDINFGCPAKTVNRHGGGAMLLDTPDVLFQIASALRKVVPSHIPFSAKMRLGVSDKSRAVECALALESGGVESLTVHARTKLDGYRPPAHWEWIATVQDAVKIPVIANGEIWSVEDYIRCRSVSGIGNVMLGRGAVADPFLARRIKAYLRGDDSISNREGEWEELLPLIARYWMVAQRKVVPKHVSGRLKTWLAWLRRTYPEADELYQAVRTLNDLPETERVMSKFGVPVRTIC